MVVFGGWTKWAAWERRCSTDLALSLLEAKYLSNLSFSLVLYFSTLLSSRALCSLLEKLFLPVVINGCKSGIASCTVLVFDVQ